MTLSSGSALKLALVVALGAAVVAVASAQASRQTPAFRWIEMLDNEHGYALSGQDGYDLLWTSNGGGDWTNVTPGRGAIHPSGPLSVFGSSRLFSRKLRRPHTFAAVLSSDGGRTWRQSQPFIDRKGQDVGQPFTIDTRHFFIAVDEGAAAGSQSEALYTSHDGARHWAFVSRTPWSHPETGELPIGCDKNGFAFATPQRGWATGECAGGPPFLYKTEDGGKTWHRQALTVPTQCACNTSAPAFFSADAGAISVTGFAANGAGAPIAYLAETHDGGKHWQSKRIPGVGRVAQVSFLDPHNIWVTGTPAGRLHSPFDRLMTSSDSGRHWHATALPFDAGDVHFDVLNSQTAYGVRFASASNTIVVTHDGGRTWTTIHAKLDSTVAGDTRAR